MCFESEVDPRLAKKVVSEASHFCCKCQSSDWLLQYFPPPRIEHDRLCPEMKAGVVVVVCCRPHIGLVFLYCLYQCMPRPQSPTQTPNLIAQMFPNRQPPIMNFFLFAGLPLPVAKCPRHYSEQGFLCLVFVCSVVAGLVAQSS